MAQKYIVGDWVKFLFEESKIIEVYEDDSYFMASPNITGCPKEEELSPIPLVPSILEKNGWKKFKRPYSRDYCFKRKGYPTLNIRSDKEVFFHWGDKDKSITTVHELQHLLFGLGLNSEMEV